MRDRIFLGRSFLTPNPKEGIAIVWGVYTQIRTKHWFQCDPTSPPPPSGEPSSGVRSANPAELRWAIAACYNNCWTGAAAAASQKPGCRMLPLWVVRDIYWGGRIQLGISWKRWGYTTTKFVDGRNATWRQLIWRSPKIWGVRPLDKLISAHVSSSRPYQDVCHNG